MRLEDCVEGYYVRLKGHTKYPENQLGKVVSIDEKGIVRVQLMSESTWVNFYTKHHNQLVLINPKNPRSLYV